MLAKNLLHPLKSGDRLSRLAVCETWVAFKTVRTELSQMPNWHHMLIILNNSVDRVSIGRFGDAFVQGSSTKLSNNF